MDRLEARLLAAMGLICQIARRTGYTQIVIHKINDTTISFTMGSSYYRGCKHIYRLSDYRHVDMMVERLSDDFKNETRVFHHAFAQEKSEYHTSTHCLPWTPTSL